MEKLPAQMTVVGISKPGGPEVLVPETRALPVPGPGEILVKVLAAGVNRPDVAQRSGAYPPPPGASDLPGLEIAGEVVALGAGARQAQARRQGDVAGGRRRLRAILHRAGRPGDDGAAVLVDAGSRRHSGNPDDGLAQCVRARRAEARRDAADPWRLVRHRHHGDPARQGARLQGDRHRRIEGQGRRLPKLGADLAINYKTEDFVEATKKATDGAGANVILDMVGGDYIDRNYDAAAVDGRIVQIAFLSGTPKATVNFSKVMVKRLLHTGSTLRPRSNADKAAMVAAIEAKVMPLLRDGRVKPVMDSTFPLEKAADAHRRMETSEHIGKIVLAI